MKIHFSPPFNKARVSGALEAPDTEKPHADKYRFS